MRKDSTQIKDPPTGKKAGQNPKNNTAMFKTSDTKLKAYSSKCVNVSTMTARDMQTTHIALNYGLSASHARLISRLHYGGAL